MSTNRKERRGPKVPKDLQREWNQKLKASGFQDIEKWGSDKIIKGHIRWSHYKTPNNFKSKAQFIAEYFRIIGLYANQCPTASKKYIKVLQKYVEVGSKPKAIEGTDIPLGTFKSYLARNFSKMVKFVRELEEEEDMMDRMIEKHADALARLKDHD